MSVAAESDQLWSTMPGWGIYADLTPPELTSSRQLRVLRKLITFSLIVLILLCAAGYTLAVMKRSSAAKSLATQEKQAAQLQTQVSKYAGITQIQGAVADVQANVSKLMAGDVDFTNLLTEIRTALPGSMTIANESVNVSNAAIAGGVAGASLDNSGAPVIGTVTLSGSANKYNDISAYVDRLAQLKGIANLVPTSASKADKTGAVTYNLTFNVTNVVLSHRFDPGKNGGK